MEANDIWTSGPLSLEHWSQRRIIDAACDMEMSVRTYNQLAKHGIQTFGDLKRFFDSGEAFIKFGPKTMALKETRELMSRGH